MKAAAFDYTAPETLDEVLALLAEHGDEARVIAGGQSLVPMMAFRLSRPGLLIDLNKVAGLDTLEAGSDRFRVGAMVRQRQILSDPKVAQHMPALAAATRLVGHHQTRNRGTIGGSVALADPAAENPALALALDAGIVLASRRGERTLPASEFFTGAYTTAIEPDELLVAIDYPVWPQATILVEEVTRRPGDFALTGIVVAIDIKGGRIDRAGIAWFGMSTEPSRARGAEALLIGRDIAGIDPSAVAQAAIGDVEAKDDVQASADYRRVAGLELATRVITTALKGNAA